MEVALPNYQHTQRVQTSKELSLVLPSSSDKNSGQDQVADDATKKLRTRRTKQPSSQEIEAKAQLALLKTQCDALFKAMNAACKPKDPITLKTKANLAIHGTNLLLHSSSNWQSVASSSRSRDFRSIAGAAVLEFNIIAEYRDGLIRSEPAASHLRSSFAAQLQPYMKRKSTILHTLTHRRDEPAEFFFVDRIIHSSIDESGSFTISDTFPSWVSYRDKQGDQAMVQKIVCSIEKCPLAWQDPSNLAESKSPELSEEVQVALRNLVQVSAPVVFLKCSLMKALQVLEQNAYCKRWGECNDHSDPDINLGIVF